MTARASSARRPHAVALVAALCAGCGSVQSGPGPACHGGETVTVEAGADLAADGVPDAGLGDAAPRDADLESAAPVWGCPGGNTSRNGITDIDLTRAAYLGTTDIEVVFCNPLMDTQPHGLVFLVIGTDHVDFPPSSATKPTWIVTSTGARADSPFTWNGSNLADGNHHQRGLLTGPSEISDGMGGTTPLITLDAAWIELHLDGIGGDGADLSFRWERKYFP